MSPRYETSAARHNRVNRQMIMALKDTLEEGATFEEMAVIGESFIVGVALLVKELGGDKVVIEAMLEAMFEGAKKRLGETRVSPIIRPWP